VDAPKTITSPTEIDIELRASDPAALREDDA